MHDSSYRAHNYKYRKRPDSFPSQLGLLLESRAKPNLSFKHKPTSQLTPWLFHHLLLLLLLRLPEIWK